MIQPYKLPKEIVAALQVRLKDEYNAHFFYTSASNWCNDNGFLKAAEYFGIEAADELLHAKGIQEYLVNWNVVPDIAIVTSLKAEFTDLSNVIEKAYGIEFKLYQEYEAISRVIFQTDLCTFDFLQKYREIQVKSVADYATKINILEGVELTKTNLLLIEKKLF
jgi:ferritin